MKIKNILGEEIYDFEDKSVMFLERYFAFITK